MYPFGKDFQYVFEPQVDNEPVQLPTSDTPAIYIYTQRPSRSNGRTGGGSPVQTIASWTETDAYSRTFTVSAISDPDPTNESTIPVYEYWIAINYRLQTGAQQQTEIRRLQMERSRAAFA